MYIYNAVSTVFKCWLFYLIVRTSFALLPLIFNFSDEKCIQISQALIVDKCWSWDSNSHLWIQALVSFYTISPSKFIFLSLDSYFSFPWKNSCHILLSFPQLTLRECITKKKQYRNSWIPRDIFWWKKKAHTFLHIREKS